MERKVEGTEEEKPELGDPGATSSYASSSFSNLPSRRNGLLELS